MKIGRCCVVISLSSILMMGVAAPTAGQQAKSQLFIKSHVVEIRRADRTVVRPLHTIQIGPGFASGRATVGPDTATWNTTYLLVDYRAISSQSPYGFHFRYGTGTQGGYSGSGIFAGSGGRNSFLTADATYSLLIGNTIGARVVTGYGTRQWNAGSASVTINGPRLGFDVLGPLHTSSAYTLSLIGSAVWLLSNTSTVTAGPTTTVSPDSGFQWGITLRLKSWPSSALRPDGQYRTASTEEEVPPEDWQVFAAGTEWSMEICYCVTTSSSGSPGAFDSSGFYLTVGKSF